ncbi:MAG: DUF362 domain-containing protein [Promethearchaeota archaeon]
MEKKEELEVLFKKMMKDFEDISKNDEIYHEDIKDLGKLKIQWKICGIYGYQILEPNHYTYTFGEKLDNPDITFTWRDPDEAIKFLKGEPFEGFTRIPLKEYKRIFRYRYVIGSKVADRGKGVRRIRLFKTIMSARFKKEKPYHPFMITKLPMFRRVRKLAKVTPGKDRENYGSYIPINQSLGTFENEILPVKVFKHFFEKASNIVMLNKCPCRVLEDCQNHDKTIGCLFLGDDSLNMLITKEQGRVISSEDALEILTKSVGNGLIPILGRARGDAVRFSIEDTGRFMTMCFCCSCCCLNAKVTTHGSVAIANLGSTNRMRGIAVKVNEDLCVGCRECLEVCVFKGMEIHDDVARVNQQRCLGCGRCEQVCPNNAISITIEDASRVNELIARLESYVDVSSHSLK